MTSEQTPLTTISVVPSGKDVLIAGLHWQWEPARGRRRMRIEARDQLASHWLALPAGTADEPASWLGCLADDAPDFPKGKRPASLTAALLANVPPDCWGVFLLPDGQWWFMAMTGGHPSPYGDVVGDAAAVKRATERFRSTVPAPASGWTVFDPDKLLDDVDAQRSQLSALLPAVVPASARLHKTDSRTAWHLTLAVVVLVLGAWGGNYWLELKQKAEHDAWVQAELVRARQAAEQKTASLSRPWGGQPDFSGMITACVHQWRKSYLSIAGARIREQTCDVSGKLTLHYQLQDGVTVSDFAARLLALYGPDVQATFNMPGPSDDASFTLPVPFIAAPAEALLPGDEQLRRMTSYAQRLRANLRFSEPEVLTQTVGQEHVPLPWRRYSFTFITDIPPDRLFDALRFPGNGLRLKSLKTEQRSSRLTYTLEGMLYAEN